MNAREVKDLSTQLKNIARDLSFLGHPRYPLRELHQLFPQHKAFIDLLEDQAVPFPVDVSAKRRMMDDFLKRLSMAEVPAQLKKIFTQRIQDYRQLLNMMENFGTVFFYEHCTQLYGSSLKRGTDSAFTYFIQEIPNYCLPDSSREILQGEEALAYLRRKMLETFDPKDFEVKPSSSLLSDSSAGRRTLKLNPHKEYTTGQLDIFLVHEGWVHLGTSLNGAKQEHHQWLSTWAPRTTFLQEGLAIVTELISGHMTIERWNKVVLRHLATSIAERGSSVTEVYTYLRHHGLEELDAFKLSLRVFRGVPLGGGAAFTKELLYLHGMIELLHHLSFFRTELRSLWVGKISFEEHILLPDLGNFPVELSYFPAALDQPEVRARLERLKELSSGLFNRGFL